MQLYALPDLIRGLVFDIDKTLYDHEAYARHQSDVLVERLAEERASSVEFAREEVEAWRDEHERRHGVRQSLGNTFAALGIPMETSIEWRVELIRPDRFLGRDRRLREALDELRARYRIIAVTNNPERVGRATLEALGVDDLFAHVVGLDTTKRSKPDPRPFLHAARVLGCPAKVLVSVGDRYDVDIAPALKIGMGGVLVDGVRDVYSLSERLLEEHPDAGTAV